MCPNTLNPKKKISCFEVQPRIHWNYWISNMVLTSSPLFLDKNITLVSFAPITYHIFPPRAVYSTFYQWCFVHCRCPGTPGTWARVHSEKVMCGGNRFWYGFQVYSKRRKAQPLVNVYWLQIYQTRLHSLSLIWPHGSRLLTGSGSAIVNFLMNDLWKSTERCTKVHFHNTQSS